MMVKDIRKQGLKALKYLQDATQPSDPVKAQITGGKGVKALSDHDEHFIQTRLSPHPKVNSKLFDHFLGRADDALQRRQKRSLVPKG